MNFRFRKTLMTMLMLTCASLYAEEISDDIPSLELLEFLGEFTNEDGAIVDPWSVTESKESKDSETVREERKHD